MSLERLVISLYAKGMSVSDIEEEMRDGGKVINKTVYLAVGLDRTGRKEVLGMWVGKAESSSFWMTVLTDMKSRGVEDILITCTDNLNGFTDTIRSVFPQAATRICVVHQIRNCCKYVVYKDLKAFMADMKEIYSAPNRDIWRRQLLTASRRSGARSTCMRSSETFTPE